MAGYQTQSADTSPEIERRIVEQWRTMSTGQKLQAVDGLTVMARTLAKVGIRRMYPLASEEEVKLRLAARLLGRDAAIEVYGWDPEAPEVKGR